MAAVNRQTSGEDQLGRPLPRAQAGVESTAKGPGRSGEHCQGPRQEWRAATRAWAAAAQKVGTWLWILKTVNRAG